MTMKVMPTSKSIVTNKSYAFDEVYEKLKAEATLPAEPYIHKVFGLKGIYIPATKTHDVSITVSKKKITVAEAAKPTLKNMAADFVTSGWSTIGGSQLTNITDIVNEVAGEVQRIFGG